MKKVGKEKSKEGYKEEWMKARIDESKEVWK